MKCYINNSLKVKYLNSEKMQKKLILLFSLLCLLTISACKKEKPKPISLIHYPGHNCTAACAVLIYNPT